MASRKYVRFLVSLIFLGGTWSSTVEAKGGAGWKTFTSQEGGFQALFPGAPKLTTNVHKSFVGAIQENTYESRGKTGTYSVEYSNLPGIAVDLGGENTIYNKAKKGLLESVGGKEQSFTEIFLASKYKGKELTFTTAGGHPGKAQFFLVEKRLYVLVAVSPMDNGNFGKFFGSFQLL